MKSTTQYGLRHKDQRNTYNLGVGGRYFNKQWMYGNNVFFDHDVTGSNKRIGFGAEAWTDWLRFSGNYYLGLTDWHKSRGLADFEERPANGWDVRSEGWLPSYPQLGGKVMLEQYRGEEVALFGKNRREKNPHALTAGINWTPFPLVTVGAEHRMGSGSRSDSQINLNFSLHSDLSLTRHLDKQAVAGTRMLAASRLSLVDRNNDIVLDYRKQSLLSLSLPARVTGPALEIIPLAIQVNGKYGLSRIEWSAASLENAGGKISGQGHQWSIQMPDFVAGHSNQYSVSATAYDSKGNRSAPIGTIVSVEDDTAAFDAAHSTLSGSDTQVLADGRQEVTLTLTAMDSNDQLLTGRVATFDVINTSSQPFAAFSNNSYTIGPVTEENGVYNATLITHSPGALVVTARLDGIRVRGKKVTVTALPTTAQQTPRSRFDSAPADIRIAADGVATGQLVFKVLNVGGAPLVDQKVGILLDGRRTADAVSDASGEAYVSIPAATAARQTTVVASLSNDAQSTQTVRVSYVADTATATLKRNDLSASAQTSMSYRVEARATDVGGNPLQGVNVDFSTGDVGLNLSAQRVTTDHNGIASVLAAATKDGTYAVKASVNGTEQTVTFDCEDMTVAQAAVDAKSSTFRASRTHLPADNLSTATLQFVAKDKQGNAVAALTGVSFVATGVAEVSMGDPIETAPGIYEANLRGNNIGSVDIEVKLNGATLTGSSAKVQLDAIPGVGLVRIDDINVRLGAAERVLTVSGGNKGSLTYSSSRPDVVSVSSGGVLRFLAVGDDVEITISEASEGKFLAQTQKFFVSVKTADFNLLYRPNDPVITFQGNNVTVGGGRGNGGALTPVVDDPSIIRLGNVSASGAVSVEPLRVGKTHLTITEEATPGFQSQSVRVFLEVRPAKGLELVPPQAIDVNVGDAAITPQIGGGNGGTLAFESSNPASVSVNSNGELQFLGSGVAVIKVTETNINYLEKTTSYKVSVHPSIGRLLVVPADIQMNIDDRDINPAIGGGNGGRLSFKSSNSRVVSVNRGGMLRVYGAGNSTITVVEEAQGGFDSQTATYDVTVNLLKGTPLSVVRGRLYVGPGAVCDVTRLVRGGNGGRLVASTDSPLLIVIKGNEISMQDPGYSYLKVTEEAHGNYAAQTVNIGVSISTSYTQKCH